MDIQNSIADLDCLLLEAFAPTIGKLAFKIFQQIFHFRCGERFPKLHRGTAHEHPILDFHRGNGTHYLCLNIGIATLIEIQHQISAVISIALFHGFLDTVRIVGHVASGE